MLAEKPEADKDPQASQALKIRGRLQLRITQVPLLPWSFPSLAFLACLASLQMPSTRHPLAVSSLRASTSLWEPLWVRRGAHSLWTSEAAPMRSPVGSGHGQWVQRNRNSSRWQPCPTTVTDPHELLPPCPSPQPADPESHPPASVIWAWVSSATTLCFNACSALCCSLPCSSRFLLQLRSWPWTRTDRLIFTSSSRTEEGGVKCLLHFKTLSGNFTHTYTHLFCQNLTTHWPEFNYKASIPPREPGRKSQPIPGGQVPG